MRSYLLYSSSAHFVLLAALFLLSRGALKARNEQAYYIDFIGGSKIVTMEKAAAAEGEKERPKAEAKEAQARPAAKAAPKTADPEADDFAAGLPKPSVLSGAAKLFDSDPAPRALPAGGEGGTPLVTDAANFPYPWYITQVREALWNAWTERMPSGGSLRCTVRFTIDRGGSIRGVAVEKPSGNRLFDNAADSSVRAAAPFPPLPDDFFEERLTVHVEFKAAD